jgi:hypothetical protein
MQWNVVQFWVRIRRKVCNINLVIGFEDAIRKKKEWIGTVRVEGRRVVVNRNFFLARHHCCCRVSTRVVHLHRHWQQLHHKLRNYNLHRPTLESAMDRADDSFYSPIGKSGTSRDGTNPLRPYYQPPDLKALPDAPYSSPGLSTSMPSRRHGGTGNHDFRDLFSDIDYGDYIPNTSPSVSDMAKRVMDEAIWSYTSIFLSQPFEVAKVILQCYDAGAGVQENGSFNWRKPQRRDIQVSSANRVWY